MLASFKSNQSPSSFWKILSATVWLWFDERLTNKWQSGRTFSFSATIFLLFTPQSCFGLDFFEHLDWVISGHLSSFLTMFRHQCTNTLCNPREKQLRRRNMEVLPVWRQGSVEYILHLIKTQTTISPVMQIQKPPRCFGENKRSYVDGIGVFWTKFVSLISLPIPPTKD